MRTEGDGFLTQGAGGQGSGGGDTALRRKHARQKLLFELCALVFVPWMMFTAIVVLFAYTYYEMAPFVWVVAALGLCISLGLVAMGTITEKWGPSSRSFLLALGFLCLASVSVAVTVGLFVYSEIMSEYYRITNGTFYDGIQATTPASAYSDAVTLAFKEGTFVNTRQTVGFKESGTIYCVAPVAHPAQPDGQSVQYWAVGQDCCSQRSHFDCYDGIKLGVLSGITVCDSCNTDEYRKAVAEAKDTYSLPAADNALLLKWIQDPNQLTEDLNTAGLSVVVIASVVHLVTSGCAGLFLYFAMKKRGFIGGN